MFVLTASTSITATISGPLFFLFFFTMLQRGVFIQGPFTFYPCLDHLILRATAPQSQQPCALAKVAAGAHMWSVQT